MRRVLSVLLVASSFVSLFPVPTGQAQVGPADPILDTILNQVDQVLQQPLPGGMTAEEILDEIDARILDIQNVTDDAIGTALRQIEDIESLVGNETAPYEQILREYESAIGSRVNTTRDAVLRNVSAVRAAVNDTALLGVFVDPVERDATPPVVGRNTERYYTYPSAESTSFTAPSIEINRSTWDVAPDVWLHWALGEDRRALDRLGLAYVPPGDALRDGTPGGYPGDPWRVEVDPVTGNEVWTLADRSTGAPARGTRTELVTPVIDLRALPRIDTDEFDDVAEEGLNVDPDDLADRARDEGAEVARIGQETFLIVGDVRVCAVEADYNDGRVDAGTAGAGVEVETAPGFGTTDGPTCRSDRDQVKAEVNESSVDVETGEGILNRTIDDQELRPSQRRIVDRLIGPLRGPLRAAERTLDEAGGALAETIVGARDALRGALDAVGDPAPRGETEAEVALAQAIVRHRFNFQPGDDGANVQLSLFDPQRNTWTPWRVVRPTAGPQYATTSLDEDGNVISATSERPALVALQDRRPAWAGEPLNARGLGWTNTTDTFVESTFDLSAYAGFEVRLRFFAATSSARPLPLENEGWSIDSVRVQALAHPREAGIALQLVPVPGAVVLPLEEVPVVTKVRNYGKAAIDTVARCFFAEHIGNFQSSDISCGEVALHLEPAQEQLVAFQDVRLGDRRDGRITLRLDQPVGESVVPLVTLADADAGNNKLTAVFRAETFVDHAIARVDAVPLEEIEAGIQAEGSPWRILVTVENRGNAQLAVSPSDLNLTIEDAETGVEVANLTAAGGVVAIARGTTMTGPGLGATRNRHTFAAEWVAPLPGLYRLVAEVDASRLDRRPANDEAVTFLPVRHANTGAFQDDLTQGFAVLDLDVAPSDTVRYRSEPVVVRDNTSHDDMVDRELAASGAWFGPPSPVTADLVDRTFHWFRYQGKTDGAVQNPLTLSMVDRIVSFDVWGEIINGATLDVKWCPAIVGRCGDEVQADAADDPVDDPAWTLLEPGTLDGPNGHIVEKTGGWSTYTLRLPDDEARGYIAFIWTPGTDGRGILVDDVELPFPFVEDDPLRPGRVTDTVDYRGIWANDDADEPDGYEFHTLEIRQDPPAGDPDVTRFEDLEPAQIPGFLDRHILFEIRTGEQVDDPDRKDWTFKGHVLHDTMMVVYGPPDAVRSRELPEVAEYDWHRGDGSGSLWWGAADDRVRSDARQSIEFGPVDLRDAKKGRVVVSYRGWLSDATASLQWRPFAGGPWSGLGSLGGLPHDPRGDDPPFLMVERKLGQLAGQQVMLRVRVSTPRDGVFVEPADERVAKPFEIDRIQFFQGEKEQERLLVDLDFNEIPGRLDDGLSFRQGREQDDDDSWYRLFGTPIVPTDGETYFAAFPRFPLKSAVAGEGGSTTVPVQENALRPLIRETMCLEDPIDLRWAARPTLTFDQKIFLNSRAAHHTGGSEANPYTSYDVALVQVRIIPEGNAAVDVQQPPPEDPPSPTDRLPFVIVDAELPAETPPTVGERVRRGPPACDSEIGAAVGGAIPSATEREVREWTTLHAYKDTRLDAAWTKERIDLSSFAGKVVQVRFVFALGVYWTQTRSDLATPLGDEAFEFEAVLPARNHTTHWFVDRLRVVSPDGRAYAPLDAAEEAANWDLDGAGPQAGALQLDQLRNSWTRRAFFEPFDDQDLTNGCTSGLYGHPVNTPIAAFRREDCAVRPHPTLWHEREVPGVGRAYVFGREQLPGTSGVFGFWAQEISAENYTKELGGGDDAIQSFLKEGHFAPAQRLISPVLDVANLTTPVLILRHAYNGSYLANATHRRANDALPDLDEDGPCGPAAGRPRCRDQWTSVSYVIEGRFETFDGAWSPWTILRQNLKRPDEGPVAFRGDSGKPFPTLVTDRLELESLLPPQAVGRVQIALRPMAPFDLDVEDDFGFVKGGWIVESLRVADGRVANDVALLRVRLDPVVGRVLKDDVDQDGTPDIVLPPASSLTLNLTAANRGIFGQDRVTINISWGNDTFRDELALASDRQRGASVRSIDIPGLPTPRVPLPSGALNTVGRAHHINITLELPVDDELAGDNTIRIAAVVAGIRAASLERVRVLPLVEERGAQRFLALDLSNDGNVILGKSGPLPGDTHLSLTLDCRALDGTETSTTIEVPGLPPVPPRGLKEPARALPPVPIPAEALPASGDCTVDVTYLLDEHSLASASASFAVAPEVGGDVVTRESLATWTREGALAESWNLTRDDVFSTPYAMRYTTVPGESGSAILTSPELPANLALGETSLVFAYNASLGVGDLATIEMLRDGAWRRLAWTDPDSATGERVREIAGSTGLKIVTIPNFGVEPVLVDAFPPARVPGAGRLEVLPVLDYEPELAELAPNSDRAVTGRFAASDTSVIDPIVGDKMWHLDRSEVAQGETAELLRILPQLPDVACVEFTWRAEMGLSGNVGNPDRLLLQFRDEDGDEIDPIGIQTIVIADAEDAFNAEPNTIKFWDWLTSSYTLRRADFDRPNADPPVLYDDIAGAGFGFERRAPGTQPARGMWIDGVTLREGACDAAGPGITGAGFVNGFDASDDATRRDHVPDVGWHLVGVTRSGMPFAFNSDGRFSDRSIGAFKNQGLAPNVNATLMLPILDLTRSVGNSTVLSFYAKQDLQSGRDAWWLLYSSKRPGDRWSDWTFLPIAQFNSPHPLLTENGGTADLACGPNPAGDTCVGAFREVPFEPDPDPDDQNVPGRFQVFSGDTTRLDPWRRANIDLTKFQGREVRFAIRLATDSDGPSRGVLFDDFVLATEVLQGAPTRLRFVVDSAGRSEGSTLMVDHLRLLGDRADTNLALAIAAIDGVDLLRRGRVDGGLFVVQPGEVATFDLEVTNKGRLPTCNVSGVLATTQLRTTGASNFDPVGWQVRRCLAPGERATVTVPLLRDASGPIEVPDVDVDGDRVLASADPDPVDHLEYRITAAITGRDDDESPEDDTAFLGLRAQPSRAVHATLKLKDVSPRVLDTTQEIAIVAELVSDAGAALPVTVRPILVDDSPSHSYGWGDEDGDDWVHPTEYTGEAYGLTDQTLGLAPGERPVLTWTATNLTDLEPGLYRLVVETIVPEDRLLDEQRVRSSPVPIWLGTSPIYLRQTFEGKLIDGVLGEGEWAELATVQLSQVADPTVKKTLRYSLALEEGTLFGVLVMDEFDYNGFETVLFALEDDPEARFEQPGDGMRLASSLDGGGAFSEDVVWLEGFECNSTNIPSPSNWCNDQVANGFDDQVADDQLTAAATWDSDARVAVFEFKRPMNTTDTVDIALEPFQALKASFAFFDGEGPFGVTPEDQILYTWPVGVDPYAIELDAETGAADVASWGDLQLPAEDGLPAFGDDATSDQNVFANTGGEGLDNYWRRVNGAWRWADSAKGNCGGECPDGGGEFNFLPAAGESGEDDGAYVFTGRTEDNQLDTADALVSPAFMVDASRLEGAVLRFNHRYAFEGKQSGGTVQMQLARWAEEDPPPPNAPGNDPPENTHPPGGYWTFDVPWITLGPAFEPPHERGAGGRSPDAFDEMVIDLEEPDDPNIEGFECGTPSPYVNGCEPIIIDDQRVWGSTFASEDWTTARVDLSMSALCDKWQSEIAQDVLNRGIQRDCEGTRAFADDTPIYETRDLLRAAAGAYNGLDNGTQVEGDEYFRPMMPARLRFVVGSEARDGVASAVWAIDDVSISAYDPLLSVVRTVRDPFNLTLLEGEPQVLELVVRNGAKVPDTVRLDAGFRGPRAPGWGIGVLGDDGNVLESAERELLPTEEWRVPIVIRPSVGVLAPDQQYLFRVLFTARSLSDPLAANSVTFNVKHATTLHPELIVTEVRPRTQGRLSDELGAGAFQGVPVTVQGTLVNLGVQDADSVKVALEVTDPTGNVTRVAAPNGADALTVRLVTGGGGLSRVAFEWRPQATGLHTLALIADVDDAHSEANEANNRREITLEVLPLPLPDLEVVDLAVLTPEGDVVDGAIAEAQLVHVVATVVNSGLSAAKDVRVEFRGGRELFWTERGGPLASVEPGTRVRVLAPWSAFTAGDRDVEITALALFTPSEGGFFDADVEDNAFSRFVEVSKPAVALRSLRAALDTRPDAVVKVPITVANDGNAVDTLRLVPSVPEPLRAAFFPASEIPLAPGHHVDGAMVLVVPPLTPPGTYDLVLKALSSVGQSTGEQRLSVEVRPAAAFAAITATPSLAPDGGDVELRLMNTGNERLTGPLAIELPPGFEVEGALPHVNLVPGEATALVARVRPTEVPEPGELILRLGVEGVPAPEKDVRVEVRSEGRVHVELVEAVHLTTDEANDVPLRVTNAGNLPVEARVTTTLAPELGRVEGLPVTLQLDPGAQTTVDVRVIPATAFAELPVRVVTAWEDKIVGLAASADLPDLAVLGIDLASDPVQGETVVALVRVGNAGTAASPASTVSVYVDEVLAAVGEIEPIAPGEERVARIEITPAGGLQGLTAVVDEAGNLREGVEANNAHHVTMDAETPGVIGSLRRAVPAPGFTALLMAVVAAALVSRRGLGGRERRR